VKQANVSLQATLDRGRGRLFPQDAGRPPAASSAGMSWVVVDVFAVGLGLGAPARPTQPTATWSF
jgi:hypothetical protein